ncbi:MAG: VOC family protein [Erysipelotrichaceae bacterium]|jgi:uncharacterized glyoxalase superfamily protein PhnB|nr:VOC family protein [Erysipelotrichaceae bacterium]
MFQSITANLMVESVEESLGFYKDILGFMEVDSVPGNDGSLQFAIVIKDSCQLMFQKRESLVAEYPILAAKVTKPSISLFVMVSDFDACYQAVKSKREPLTDLHTTFYGTKEFALADNSGYVITIAEAH